MNNPKAIVALNNSTLRISGQTLWRQLDLTVSAGECVAVLGPNGAGKSSLIKTLLGLRSLTTGRVELFGQKPKEARNRIGYIPQQKAFDRDVPLTGRDLVMLGLQGTRWFLGGQIKMAKEKVGAVIKEVGATSFADEPLGLLSGGEQQRLRIAQALVSAPELILCDEPLLSLDIKSQHNTITLLDQRRKSGSAIVFVTHEINSILPLVDRILYLVGGKWAIGTPGEILTSHRLSQLYGGRVEVLRVHGRILVVSTGDQTAAGLHEVHHQTEAAQ